MSKRLYGKSAFEGFSVLEECGMQMKYQQELGAGTRQAEQEEMARQKAAELEEQRQAKRARWAERNAQRKHDKAMARERKRKFKEGR